MSDRSIYGSPSASCSVVTTMKLALHGGPPLRSTPWTTWPPRYASTVALLTEVVNSGRWSPTGISSGADSFDRRFSRAFASYLGVTHCVTTTNGTTAVRLALEAAGIGWGDEVIVPALTWVADADAVMSVGATPIFVDIDPTTLCISPVAAAHAVTRRTRAIIAVHLNGAVADLERLTQLATDGVVLIEDAAQAHGAEWHGTKVGAVAHLGAFSMHNSKLLTAGEGGAVVTSSVTLADRLEALRANGRSPRRDPTPAGEMEYRHTNGVTGTNACLSEFQAAVLLDLLPRLDELNAACIANARYLERELGKLGLQFPQTSPGTSRVYSGLAFQLAPDVLATASIDTLAAAFGAECRVAFKRLHRPLGDSPLFRPETRPSWRWFAPSAHGYDEQSLPGAWTAYRTMLCVPHPYLRGSEEDMNDIVGAVEKVLTSISQLKSESWTLATSPVS